jgi:hypothetical protein
MRHVVTEEGEGGDNNQRDVEYGEEEGEPDADKLASRAVDDEEDMNFGGTRYGRTFQDAEYEEEEPPPPPAVYEQFELPEEPEDPLNLNPIPIFTSEEEEEPYDLEHYVPDGGIVEYERTGEWGYDADGGITPDERLAAVPSEPIHRSYEREVKEEPLIVDNRRARHLDAYEGGAVFDQLEEEPTESTARAADDMFDWVIRSTLETLDTKGGDLQGSAHGSSHGSDKDKDADP